MSSEHSLKGVLLLGPSRANGLQVGPDPRRQVGVLAQNARVGGDGPAALSQHGRRAGLVEARVRPGRQKPGSPSRPEPKSRPVAFGVEEVAHPHGRRLKRRLVARTPRPAAPVLPEPPEGDLGCPGIGHGLGVEHAEVQESVRVSGVGPQRLVDDLERALQVAARALKLGVADADRGKVRRGPGQGAKRPLPLGVVALEGGE